MRQDSILDLFPGNWSITKPDGSVFAGLRCRVAGERAILLTDSVPLEVGDTLSRPLPNGLKDEFIIEDWTYQEALLGQLPNRFHLSVRRAALSQNPPVPTQPAGQTTPGSPRESTMPAPNHPVRAKSGPTKDIETARRVAAIVGRFAAGHPLSAILDEVCDALDEDELKCPTTWRKRDPPILSWSDAAATEPDLARKAIEHRLKNAKE